MNGIAQSLTLSVVVLFLVGTAFGGTTVLDFSEFDADKALNWNATGYADHLPQTPAIVTEVYADGPAVTVRKRLAGEQADFAYPVAVLGCDSYPQRGGGDLDGNSYAQFFRFRRDDAVDAGALVAIESFDLLSNPGTKQAPGVKIWIENSRRRTVWGPVIVSPYGAKKGRIWRQEVPPTVKADREMTLWIQDLDPFNKVNLRDGYWSIDNLRFSQLTKAEARARQGYDLARVGREAKELAMGSLNPARFEVAHFPSKRQVVVAISVADKMDVLDQLRAECGVSGAHGQGMLVQTTIDKFTDEVVAGVLDVKDLKPATYQVQCRLYQAGRLIGQHSEKLTIKPLPPWWDNKLGILPEDQVPAPWTNLQVKSDPSGASEIRCWNRAYRYRNSLLPVQIVTAGAEILDAPVQLRGTVNGRKAATGHAHVTFTKKTNARVEWTTAASLGDLPVRTETWMEYDGFAWIKLYLEPKSPVTVSKLQLAIPVKRRYATLYNSDREDDLKGIGAVEDRFFTRFDPIWNRAVVCWLGDEYRGIHWCAESDRNWQLNDPHQGIGYVRHAKQVVVTINFIDHQVKIDKPTEFEFGLMATPIKPMPRGRRSWRFGFGDDPGTVSKGGTGATKYGPIGTTHELGFSYWSKYLRTRYPVPNEEAAGRIKLLEKQGIKVLPDCTLVWINPIGPEYRYFQDEWHPAPFALPDVDKMDADKDWLEYPACPGNKSFVDWKIWQLNKMIKQLNLPGIYFDMSFPVLCGSHWHGCGFQDPNRSWPPVRGYFPDGYGPALPYRRLIDQVGHYHPETQILATRELFKRFYVVAKQHDPDFMIVYHSSGDMHMAINSFCTAVYLGEEFRRPPPNYYQKLPLDTFRAKYMGHNLGPVSLFLPEFASSAHRSGGDPNFWYSPQADKQIRQLIGMLLVHDCDATPSFSTLEPYNRLRKAQDRFGQWDDDMQFLPYWNNAEYVRVRPVDENLVCSVFRGKPKNAKQKPRVMLVLFNNTDKDVTATLKLNFDKLAVTGRELLDLRTDEKFAVKTGVAVVDMPYRDFRMLLIK